MNENTRPHPHLSLRSDGAVLTVTLDNASRRNPQTPSLWFALADVARTLPDEVRVVVLAGAGASFSAGLDRGMLDPNGMAGEPNLLAMCADDPDGAAAQIAQYQEAFTLWRSCPAVVVAAVQGHAIGAGFQLALGADLRIVAEDVQFVMAEPSLGLVPDLGGTKPLVDLLGYSRALEICLTRRPIGAQEAVATGLAVRAVPVAELAAAADELARALSAVPPAALVHTKQLLAGAGSRGLVEQLHAERTAQVGLIGSMATALRGCS